MMENLLFSVTGKKLTFYFALTLRRMQQLATRLETITKVTPDDHADHDAVARAAVEVKAIASRWMS